MPLVYSFIVKAVNVVVPVLVNDGIYIDTRLTGKPITYYQLSLTSTDRKDSIYHSDTGSYRFVNFTS